MSLFLVSLDCFVVAHGNRNYSLPLHFNTETVQDLVHI